MNFVNKPTPDMTGFPRVICNLESCFMLLYVLRISREVKVSSLVCLGLHGLSLMPKASLVPKMSVWVHRVISWTPVSDAE